MERTYYENTQKKTIKQIILGILREQYENFTPYAKAAYKRYGSKHVQTDDIQKAEIYEHGVPASYRVTDLPQADTRGAILCVCFYDVEGVEDKEETLNGGRANIAWIQGARQGNLMGLIRQIHWSNIIA